MHERDTSPPLGIVRVQSDHRWWCGDPMNSGYESVLVASGGDKSYDFAQDKGCLLIIGIHNS